MLCIKNGRIHTVTSKETFVGDIFLKDGKIAAIGENLDSTGAEIIDATGLNIYPGLVDCHCHLGLDGYAIKYESQDYNEYTESVTPQLKGLDAFYPQDRTINMAAMGGVTCVGTGPGSSNVLGGTFIAVKTHGNNVEDMLVKDNVAMKCAFGENPKVCYKEKDITSRMTTAAKLRTILRKTVEYKARKEAAGNDILKAPAYDEKLEALIPVISGEMPLKAHAHRADDILTALRIAREFNAKITLEHCTDGHLIAEHLAAANVPLAIGPSFGHATKYELRNKTFKTPGILSSKGCQVSIITDSPVIPQEFLGLCAGLAVKSGMDEYEALKAITINPAKHLGIEDRVGSLEVGKDADVIVTDGCIMDYKTTVLHTIINGEKVENQAD